MLGLAPPSDAAEIAELVKSAGHLISIPACPLMHGTGVWLGAFIPHLAGGTVITLESRSLDPHELLEAVQRRRATGIVIVGDAFAKPIIRALDEAAERGRPYDTSSLTTIISSGVMWTAEVKEALLERIEQAVLIDAIGSTEGSMGVSITMRGVPPATAKFNQMPTTKVFIEDGREVRPGSGEIGLVAAGGNVPLGYYKDEEKSARTFKVIDGVRYSFPGDLATVNEDGSLSLLGRGSQVINTTGEKVFPEEVEEAVKRVEAVDDCLVVGVPDDRFGEAVAAVVSLLPGHDADAAAIIAEVKQHLAGYKAPKHVVFVAQVPERPTARRTTAPPASKPSPPADPRPQPRRRSHRRRHRPPPPTHSTSPLPCPRPAIRRRFAGRVSGTGGVGCGCRRRGWLGGGAWRDGAEAAAGTVVHPCARLARASPGGTLVGVTGWRPRSMILVAGSRHGRHLPPIPSRSPRPGQTGHRPGSRRPSTHPTLAQGRSVRPGPVGDRHAVDRPAHARGPPPAGRRRAGRARPGVGRLDASEAAGGRRGAGRPRAPLAGDPRRLGPAPAAA